MVGVGEFWGELLGLLEVVDGFADLAPHARQEAEPADRCHARQDGEARAKANSLHSRPLSSGIGHATGTTRPPPQGDQSAISRIPALSWPDVIGAGDENRTRTVSLGRPPITAAGAAEQAVRFTGTARG